MVCCHQYKLEAELETVWPDGFQFLLKVSRDQSLEEVRRLSQSAAHEGAAAQSDVGPDGAKTQRRRRSGARRRRGAQDEFGARA